MACAAIGLLVLITIVVTVCICQHEHKEKLAKEIAKATKKAKPPQPERIFITPAPPASPLPPPVFRTDAIFNASSERVDQFLSDVQLRQEFLGKLLTVRLVINPAGRTAIEWLAPADAFVRGKRGAKIIFGCVGSGCTFEQLEPGERCRFRIDVLAADSRLLDSITFTAIVPDRDQRRLRTKQLDYSHMAAPTELSVPRDSIQPVQRPSKPQKSQLQLPAPQVSNTSRLVSAQFPRRVSGILSPGSASSRLGHSSCKVHRGQ